MKNSEYKRKTIHVLLTIYPLFYYNINNYRLIHIAVTAVLIICWYMSEIFRYFFHNKYVPTYLLLKNMTRKETDTLTRKIVTPDWMIGYIISALFFPKEAIVCGVCVLCIGDTVAAITGVKGKRKSIRGSILGFLASSIVCILFSSNIYAAISAALLGMIAEYFSRGKIKDNYTIPFFASLGNYIFYIWMTLC